MIQRVIAAELSTDEQQRLDTYEADAQRGLDMFGWSLIAVRDDPDKLYRQYGTFANYCLERWHLEERQADRLMAAARVIKNLKVDPMGLLPANERQARELTALEPHEQRLVWDVVQQTATDGKVTAAHVKSVVTVFKDMMTTGAIDDGSGEQIAVSDVLKAAITEETYERMMRQRGHITESTQRDIDPETGEVFEGGRQKPKTNRAGDETASQGFDRCQTPPEALDPLLPYLLPFGKVWEPAAGEGFLVEALYDSGFKESAVAVSDVLTGQNFFEYEPDTWDVLVTNPPYSIKYKWLARCYALGKPFALLLPVETLGAKTAQELFRQYGLELMLLDRRVNFKMPNKGWEGSAQFPVAWFTWGLNIGQQLTFARMGDHDEVH